MKKNVRKNVKKAKKKNKIKIQQNSVPFDMSEYLLGLLVQLQIG